MIYYQDKNTGQNIMQVYSNFSSADLELLAHMMKLDGHTIIEVEAS